MKFKPISITYTWDITPSNIEVLAILFGYEGPVQENGRFYYKSILSSDDLNKCS